MLKQLLVSFTVLLFSGTTLAQKTIYGKVSDASTNESLPSANVFLNNTTLGTVTANDGSYWLAIPDGEYEVVFSFVGYQSYKIKTSNRDPDSVRRDVKLIPSEQELDSVVVKASVDTEWKKLIKQFQKIFLGNNEAAADCSIRNDWCVDLEKKRMSGTRVLLAHASQPLALENYALGYKLFYDLQDFTASKKNVRFGGNVYFVEMEPPDSLQRERWERNRLSAYLGSTRHLFKSILNERMAEEGFRLRILQSEASTVHVFDYKPSGIQYDSVKGMYKFPMNEEISIFYKTSVSTMKFINGYVYFDKDGIVSDPLSLIITGDLGNSRVANLLPNDFQPGSQQYDIRYPYITHSGPSTYQLPDGTLVAIPNGSDEFDTQSSILLDSLENQVIYHSEDRPVEKVYIHFDKPLYSLGEDSWYKAYVVRGSDLSASDISTILYVEWVAPSGELISQQRLKIENGAAVGDFAISPTLVEGMYTVRAYTNWMRNEGPEFFYSRKIPVINTRSTSTRKTTTSDLTKIDLQFFPEGGTLVTGILTSLAFKAIDVNGRGIKVQGKILDEHNNLITTFQSIRNGMGIFPIIAQPNKSYHAVLPSGETYPLPAAVDNGLSLAVSNMNDSRLIVRVRPGTGYGSSSAYLIAHSRGTIHYAEPITIDDQLTDISISKAELPEGVLQLTLFNYEGLPLCERMVFIRKGNQMVVALRSDKEQYLPRDSITLNVTVTGRYGKPAETSLSVSVTDATFVNEGMHSENIYTRFLLQSDIKGNVEQPGWYFDSPTTEKTYALDLVMLTHGWSRYSWKKMSEPATDSASFLPEKGISLEGQIMVKGKPVGNAPFTIKISQPGHEYFNIYESDSLGHFHLPDLDFSDSTQILMAVMSGKKGLIQNAEIQLDATKGISPITPINTYQPEMQRSDEPSDVLRSRYAKVGVWKSDNVTMLDEVVVKGSRVANIIPAGHGIVVRPDTQDLESRIPTSQFVNRYAMWFPFAVLRTMADGTEVWGVDRRNKFVPIVLIINGEKEETTGFAGNPQTILSGIPLEQIAQVYANGLTVAVWTKSAPPLEGVGTVKMMVVGYNSAREFYHPKYVPLNTSSIPFDNRTTIYWNANLKTDQNGNATATFYNSDITKKLFIVVEGIAEGLTLSATKSIGKD